MGKTRGLKWCQFATDIFKYSSYMNFVLFNGPSSEFGLFKNQKNASLQLILNKQVNKVDISSLQLVIMILLILTLKVLKKKNRYLIILKD